jgi:hypothetical protein
MYILKNEDLLCIAYEFHKRFDYEIISKTDIHGMGCAYYTLQRKKYPTINFVMEKCYLAICIDDFELSAVYKFLHPEEIIRSHFFYLRKKKNFERYFIEDYMKYFAEFIKHKNEFSLQEYLDFYKKYPSEVWKWIEK